MIKLGDTKAKLEACKAELLDELLAQLKPHQLEFYRKIEGQCRAAKTFDWKNMVDLCERTIVKNQNEECTGLRVLVPSSDES